MREGIHKFIDHLLFGFLWLFSLQPFWLLYAKSGPLAFLLHRVFRYRRKVVERNVRSGFPEKSNKEILRLTRFFYRYLADTVMESVKCLTISKRSLLKRITCQNPEVIEKYAAQKQSVILASAHYGNWEYLIYSMNLLFSPLAIGVGKPLANQVLNELTNAKRAKFGMKIINALTIKDFFAEHRDVITATLFLADQYPGKRGFETPFLGKPTLFAYGIEKYGKTYNYPVIYADIYRVSRGRYSIKLIEISNNPANSEYGEIMNKYVALFKATIIRNPEYWLWSHKRWKNIPGFYAE